MEIPSAVRRSEWCSNNDKKQWEVGEGGATVCPTPLNDFVFAHHSAAREEQRNLHHSTQRLHSTSPHSVASAVKQRELLLFRVHPCNSRSICGVPPAHVASPLPDDSACCALRRVKMRRIESFFSAKGYGTTSTGKYNEKMSLIPFSKR